MRDPGTEIADRVGDCDADRVLVSADRRIAHAGRDFICCPVAAPPTLLCYRIRSRL
jgi:hypothetical protein